MSDTNVITDRHAIAEAVAAGLAELDELRDAYHRAQGDTAAAQNAEAAAAELYASKINQVLATGWATPAGLAAQNHEAPKKRTTTRSKRAASNEAVEPVSHDDEH